MVASWSGAQGVIDVDFLDEARELLPWGYLERLDFLAAQLAGDGGPASAIRTHGRQAEHMAWPTASIEADLEQLVEELTAEAARLDDDLVLVVAFDLAEVR